MNDWFRVLLGGSVQSLFGMGQYVRKGLQTEFSITIVHILLHYIKAKIRLESALLKTPHYHLIG